MDRWAIAAITAGIVSRIPVDVLLSWRSTVERAPAQGLIGKASGSSAVARHRSLKGRLKSRLRASQDHLVHPPSPQDIALAHQNEDACVTCIRHHCSTCAAPLSEALRYARDKGMDHPQIAACPPCETGARITMWPMNGILS